MSRVPHEISEIPACPRWLHRWAVLTVCTTVPLLLLGAEVTTKQVGMVDPVGFREPWHLFTVMDRALREVGFLIEHSHRLVGFVVGSCAILLAVGLWLRGPSRGLRWLGVGALAGVSVQGLLGGFRVDLNALMGNNLALIHGCFAQIVFAMLVSIAWLTSRSASAPLSTSASVRNWNAIQRWSLFTVGLVYLQIIFGGIVRHHDIFWGARVHLLSAFAVVAAIVWLMTLIKASHALDRTLQRFASFLAALILLQLLLGVEAWMSRFGSPQWRQLQALWTDLPRTLHYLVSAALFSTSVLLTLQAYRSGDSARDLDSAAVRRLEEAA